MYKIWSLDSSASVNVRISPYKSAYFEGGGEKRPYGIITLNVVLKTNF